MAAKKKTQTAAPSQSDPRAPLDADAFLSAAQRVVAILRDDLLTRADASPGVTEALKAQWTVEKEARRTGDPWEVWRRRVVVQVAAAWVLSLVFARTLEDRGLVERNRIAGPGATDSQEQFRGIAPYLSDRDYLLTVFGELANLPAANELFDPAHNPVWKLGPSIDGARALLDLFRAPDAEAPAFRFGQADTRFLGDLYQSLDEETQERFALLQTPHFVETYILDRTLERAIARFGLDDTTLIDPTCGSGHFLLGAFERLVDHRLRSEPGLDVREAARKALDAVYGADINPYAVAIARFRMTLAFLEKGGYTRLADAPALPIRLVVGDSLLHAPSQVHLGDVVGTSKEVWAGREFALEDEDAAKDVLLRRYAAVVGNPPYITVKDPILRQRYRDIYPRSAAREYSLGAPFTERFFLLARQGGFIGMITANSFMKREFGKKLIEEFLPTVNIDGVVNTSGAYIPGHGTPTALLFGTNEREQGNDVLTVLAKRGEPSTPDEPAHGLVWTSIADHGEEVGFDNEYISVARIARATLAKHPWSLGGGGAAELKALLEERSSKRLGEIVDEIGFVCLTRADDIYFVPRYALRNAGIGDAYIIENVEGEVIRDWAISEPNTTVFPYDAELHPVSEAQAPAVHHFLWPYRSILWLRREPNGNHRDLGRTWWEWSRFQRNRFHSPLLIAFAFVATHNHFVLDRGGKVFKQSAPIIKLKEGATEDDHLALLAYLNSSTACFWMKQVFFDKGNRGEGGGTTAESWEKFFEFDGTKLKLLPVPALTEQQRGEAIRLANGLMASVHKREELRNPVAIFQDAQSAEEITRAVAGAEQAIEMLEMRVRTEQEDLDWFWYEVFGLGPRMTSSEPVRAGYRAADVLFARACLSGEVGRRYFELCRLPSPEVICAESASSDVMERIRAIARSPELRLIETPTNKRTFREGFRRLDWHSAAGAWLRTNVEHALESSTTVLSSQSLFRSCVAERQVLCVLRWFVGREPEPLELIHLLEEEAAPFCRAYRHTESGLEKRAAWERVWALQRAEDRGEKVPPFDPPPKYEQKDYRDATFWRLRGKLDVPKERFISYPGCESDEDKEPVYGWAGWNHLQQAIALATLYLKRKQGEAWAKERLVPMLAGLDELLPWIGQWHPDPTPESGGMKPGQYIADFLSAQCQELGVTLDDLRAWRPDGAKRNGAAAAKKARAPRKPKASTEEETP